MDGTSVGFIWQDRDAATQFRTGVCLHGHTMYSVEPLTFLPRYLDRVPGAARVTRRYDFSRAYWTPPLTPASAWLLEKQQIERLGLNAMVSLTDHDDIEACKVLQVTADRSELPVSVEWTVPYGESILHLGIHNLPVDSDRAWLSAMQAYTAAPDDSTLYEMLNSLSRTAGVLVVLNHPFWLEEGVTEPGHQRALQRFCAECLQWTHAFELNATRPWKENDATIALAQAFGRPLVSGGDRHACEPSAAINLTNARSFAEFAAEIQEGKSQVLFMPQYREPLALRVMEASWDILKPYPEYPGRERWIDRVFYRSSGGEARPLASVWKDGAPWTLNRVTGILQVLTTTRLRAALRLLLMERGEALP